MSDRTAGSGHGVERLAVTQQASLGVDRYAVHAAGSDGEPGALLAVAQEKRLSFREKVVFYAAEGRDTELFSFAATSRVDLLATYAVSDPSGAQLGTFRERRGASLVRSTWELEAPGLSAVGRERTLRVALARRAWAFVPITRALPSPFLVHLDFTTPDGEVVLSVVRRRTLRDRYDVTIPGARLDWRLAAAVAVGLDSLRDR